MQNLDTHSNDDLKHMLESCRRELAEAVRSEVDGRFVRIDMYNEIVFLREQLCEMLVAHEGVESYDEAMVRVKNAWKEQQEKEKVHNGKR